MTIKKIAAHPEGKHFLAMTSQGDVYSWGFGDGGVLGNRDNSYCKTPTRINSLGSAKVVCVLLQQYCPAKSYFRYATMTSICKTATYFQIVEIACGSLHSACISEDGTLYTWGKGKYGRLGHGDCEDRLVPSKVTLTVRAKHALQSSPRTKSPVYGVCVVARTRLNKSQPAYQTMQHLTVQLSKSQLPVKQCNICLTFVSYLSHMSLPSGQMT